MRRALLARFTLSASVALVVGCESSQPLEPTAGPDLARKPEAAPGFATLSTLPSLSRGGTGAEAYAVQQSGGVIAGYAWHTDGRMIPVKWSLQNGAWTITSLPYPATATSARAKGVNDQGDVAGNDWPGSTPHAVLWPSTGGFAVLGCNNELGEVFGLSAGGRTLAGVVQGSPTMAAVWEPGQCRIALPPLVQGGSARADAVNGNGSIVGGSASAGAYQVPVRWARVGGAWTITALDSRQGGVRGANSAGDLVGYVKVPCALPEGCNLGMIWYAAGGTRVLPTLGGSHTTPVGINSAGEVVGLSSLANEEGTAFFWSQSMGMRQLPITGGAWAFAVSGVRADGTRLVVGAGGTRSGAVVWVVRNP
jgi:uncharacterized membrane protein